LYIYPYFCTYFVTDQCLHLGIWPTEAPTQNSVEARPEIEPGASIGWGGLEDMSVSSKDAREK